MCCVYEFDFVQFCHRKNFRFLINCSKHNQDLTVELPITKWDGLCRCTIENAY